MSVGQDYQKLAYSLGYIQGSKEHEDRKCIIIDNLVKAEKERMVRSWVNKYPDMFINCRIVDINEFVRGFLES